MTRDRFGVVTFRSSVALGLILPWVTAIAVRASLVSAGKPVMPWSWVASHLLVMMIFVPVFAAPFIVSGVWLRDFLDRDTRASRRPAMGAAMGTVAALSLSTIWLHWQWWQDVSDPMVLVFMPIFICAESSGWALAGGLIGYSVGLLIHSTSGDKPRT